MTCAFTCMFADTLATFPIASTARASMLAYPAAPGVQLHVYGAAFTVHSVFPSTMN